MRQRTKTSVTVPEVTRLKKACEFRFLTLNIPADKAYAVEYAGKLNSQLGFGKMLATLDST
jgi:hypothetical protein